ncbi:MAG: ribonuclease P protein component [Candidatus Wildermuthbacteria bacterium]|nr:ribonuclease P protein component [Candidatus Wildermuthbacteria bacterium]
MLERKRRLRKKTDIQNVFKERQAFREGFLILKKAPNGLGYSRFCTVISKKGSKKATVRNRVRRRISEAVRQNLSQIKEGFDIVLMAAGEISGREDFTATEKIIGKLFARSKLLR